MNKEGSNPKIDHPTNLFRDSLLKLRNELTDTSLWIREDENTAPVAPPMPSVFFEKWLGTPASPIQAEAIDTILVESDGKGEPQWRFDKFNEAYLLWGEGSGKDWTSSRLMCYALVWLTHLKNPQAYFGLTDPKAPIEMVNVSFDEDQALYVYFKELKKAMASTIDPRDGKNWFEKRGVKVKESSKQQVIELPHFITCYSLNSREHKIEGKGTLLAVFDEMAVFKTDKAKDLFDNVISNQRTRFARAHKFIALSYKRDDYDYMMVRWDETKDDPSVYRSQKCTWEVNPRVKREDLQKSYDENPEEAERRFECKGSTSKTGYFKYKEKIKENVNKKRISPVVEETIPIRDILGIKFHEWFVGNENYSYKAHIDLAKGKDTQGEKADCAGFVMGHVEGTEDEDKPKVVVDLMMQLKAPPGKEIIFEDIRALIYSLQQHNKFMIEEVTLDGYQSTDFMQILRNKGIASELLSVDKDVSAYDTMKSLIYNNRLDYYWYPVYIRECEELQLINGKVDHPEISRRRALEEKDDKGSKDVSDGVAALCQSLLTRKGANKPRMKWMPLEGGTGFGGKPNILTRDPNAREYGSAYDTKDTGVEDDDD